MQVENIECQIAQAQIGNFLAGSGLSQEAMQQLEEHIAGCVNCKSVLNERRNELKAMLTGDKAVVDFEKIALEAEGTKAKSIATALRKKSLQQMLEPAKEVPAVRQPEPKASVEQIKAALEMAKAASTKSAPTPAPAPAKKSPLNWKPLAYSVGLAAVLVGMSMFSKNIAAIFGPRANEVSKVAANTAATSGSIVLSNELVSNPAGAPSTGTAGQPTANTDTTGTEGAAVAATSAPTTEVPKTSTTTTPPAVEPTPTQPQVLAANALGASTGALATTQFDSAESTPVNAPVAKPAVSTTPKTVVAKAPTPKVAPRRLAPRRIARKPARRIVARKPAVRSRGIKVYNP